MAEITEGGHHFDTKKLTAIGVLVSLGIVFGDIGTSPLYVMKAIVNAFKGGSAMPFDEYIEGALSCIIYTLTFQMIRVWRNSHGLWDTHHLSKLFTMQKFLHRMNG